MYYNSLRIDLGEARRSSEQREDALKIVESKLRSYVLSQGYDSNLKRDNQYAQVLSINPQVTEAGFTLCWYKGIVLARHIASWKPNRKSFNGELVLKLGCTLGLDLEKLTESMDAIRV